MKNQKVIKRKAGHLVRRLDGGGLGGAQACKVAQPPCAEGCGDVVALST